MAVLNQVGNSLTGLTGTGAFVGANTPTLITPALGVATATSINFGGTALSTYLQGTWAPTLVSSGGGTPTYTLQQGIYTQIGNRVFFSVNLVLATLGTLAAGSLTITGLPTAAAASVALACAFQTLTAGSITSVAAVTMNASTSITLYLFNAGSLAALDQANLQGTSQFVIGGNYNV